MLKALLVDDEENNLKSLTFLLEHDCEGVEVVAVASSAQQARAWLARNPIDVLFLDINMPSESGFDLLDSIAVKNFKVVFVTAYNEYALKAIKASALDYILKPISIDELRDTVEKLKRTTRSAEDNVRLVEHLLHTVHQKLTPSKIALPHLAGITFIDLNDIVSLQADSNYTIIHLKNLQKVVVTKTLKEFEELLEPAQFARIHKSYIVNLNYIKEYTTSDGGLVKMSDGNQWSISRRQVDTFLTKLKNTSLMFGHKLPH